ncbi:peptidoglycan DD-metalloendopeptidase family protein [Schnuerera sp. xch1]|uniref:murein hydrolase activator EnvC family protein n=1 Tax=Schnuerera sp. xch1 TaxID=2874283 RepID=UPI001CBC55FF|nr:M23 family metallopeptidase [Schnuerera sp. xch1]MBZ2175930.1 peptidoglycan DD-metalloendopeptidase family protein [Schnuerera sp. xch1]
MSWKKKKIVLLLAITLLCNYALVFADNVDDLKRKQQNALEKMDDVEGQINDLKSQTNDVSTQMEELDKHMNIAASELEEVENELKGLNAEIEKTVNELEEAEKNIDKKQDVFNDRLRVMYKKGNVGFLEVLLASADLEDLLSRRSMIETVVEHDTDLIKYMKEQRDIIDKKNTELKAQKASVETTKSRLEAKRDELVTASRAKEFLMNDLTKDLKKAEEQYDNLNQLAKDIESEIVRRQRVDGDYSGGVMSWPVPGHTRISSYFGYRVHPVLKTKKLHTGLDIPAPTGTSVIAAAGGVVIYSGSLGGYGNAIMVDHGGGIVTLYGHNSSLVVGEGTKVSKGDTIAKVGSTGMSTGPHCHFEVRKNGSYVDPISWVKGE